MMGRDKPPQGSLFYTGINLDKRVRSDHVLRKVAGLVDFDFVYGEVKDSYGYNGNVSVALFKPGVSRAREATGGTRRRQNTRRERRFWRRSSTTQCGQSAVCLHHRP